MKNTINLVGSLHGEIFTKQLEVIGWIEGRPIKIELDHPKVKEWIGAANIVDHLHTKENELLILTVFKDRYSVLRFFWIGQNLEVSLDVNCQSYEFAIRALFKMWAEKY